MLSLGVLILISVALANFFLGLFVLTRNSKSKINISYFIFVLSVIAWTATNYLTDNVTATDASLFYARIANVTGLLSIFSFWQFSSLYIGEDAKKILFRLPVLVAGLLVSLSPYGISAVTEVTDVAQQEIGNLYWIVVLAMLISFAGTIKALLQGRINTKNSSIRKSINLILSGVVITFVFALFTNIIIPIITNYWQVSIFGPIFTLILVYCVALGIVKHKLFDIKLAVARSLGYVISLVLLGLMYGVIVLNVVNSLLFDEDAYDALQQTVFTVLALLIALSYQPLKKYFDKLSGRLFYRDLYDPQAVISELNQALVTNVEIDSLLTKSALIIQENLKASFCTFYIRETSYFSDRIIGAHRTQPEFEDIDTIQDLSQRIHKKVISVEVASTGLVDEKLIAALKNNDIEVMARIVNTLDFEVKGIGYMFLGPKKSGSSYTKQDLKIIEIIANELVIAVENVLRFEEIEQFNVTLQKKIDDATKELKQSNEKLRALDEAKDEFVSMASHQLRTPLTSIKGYISMVLEGDAGNITNTQKEMLGQAFFSSQRMVYLISDLLNVSRLKTGKFLIESKPVYLPDLVEDEMNQLQEGAKAKNLTLTYTKPKSFPTLLLDDMKIRQVVMNFTDNAIYYTPIGGKIEIVLRETLKSIELTVKDNGIGVPKNQQPKMFTKFYRADNARKARPDGTGLGLFMAKKVIIAQGGSVIFDSKEGKGSTFGFSFPREKLEVTTPETTKD